MGKQYPTCIGLQGSSAKTVDGLQRSLTSWKSKSKIFESGFAERRVKRTLRCPHPVTKRPIPLWLYLLSLGSAILRDGLSGIGRGLAPYFPITVSAKNASSSAFSPSSSAITSSGSFFKRTLPFSV